MPASRGRYEAQVRSSTTTALQWTRELSNERVRPGQRVVGISNRMENEAIMLLRFRGPARRGDVVLSPTGRRADWTRLENATSAW